MSAPVAIKVSERFEGTRRVLEADGWEWVTSEEFGDDEPRVSDDNLAPRMGLPLHKLRELSGRHEEAGNVTPLVVSTTVVETGGRPGKRRFYTEADALFMVTRSDKSKAIQLTKGMIQIVIAVRRHIAATVAVKAHERALPTPKALPEPRQFPAPQRPPRKPGWENVRYPLTVQLSVGPYSWLLGLAEKRGQTPEDVAERVLMGAFFSADAIAVERPGLEHFARLTRT